MAAHAQHRRIGKFGDDASRVLSVTGQRAMTSFTSYAAMLTFTLGICDIGMAGLAGCVPGELDWTGANFAQSGRPEMSVLAETRGHDQPPDHQKHDDAHGQERQDADQVSGVPQEIVHAESSCNWRTGRCAGENTVLVRGGIIRG